MKTTNKLYLLAFALIALSFSGCRSENPVPENDRELITDVTLIFERVDDNGVTEAPISFKASDPEGIETGQTPTVETVKLKKGSTYKMTISVVNSIENEDITTEILEEADEHQFYFLGTAFIGDSAPLTYSYDDVRIGLKGTVVSATDPGTNNAQMRIVLRHDLDKNYPGASNPNFSEFVSAGGESDLDITFPLVIE